MTHLRPVRGDSRITNWGGDPPLEVVTLCGSTRFRDEFESANAALTLTGRIVISVGLFAHQIEGFDWGVTKENLDELHLRKIDLADAVYVVNPGGYIGESTRREIAYATRTGKRVDYLVPLDVET